mmetsp:Transcript_20719/g.67029  ORF Transcript_20719/g.67029 Transcript_20719/m.67029 type:complete len:275 (+) Transcript_20719:216-1040(+)
MSAWHAPPATVTTLYPEHVQMARPRAIDARQACLNTCSLAAFRLVAVRPQMQPSEGTTPPRPVLRRARPARSPMPSAPVARCGTSAARGALAPATRPHQCRAFSCASRGASARPRSPSGTRALALRPRSAPQRRRRPSPCPVFKARRPPPRCYRAASCPWASRRWPPAPRHTAWPLWALPSSSPRCARPPIRSGAPSCRARPWSVSSPPRPRWSPGSTRASWRRPRRATSSWPFSSNRGPKPSSSPRPHSALPLATSRRRLRWLTSSTSRSHST